MSSIHNSNSSTSLPSTNQQDGSSSFLQTLLLTHPYLLTTALLLIITTYKFIYRYLYLHDKPPKNLKLIPGPLSTIPYLGRLHGIDPVAPWKTMHALSKNYANKMFRLTAYGQMHIWIGDAKIAKELLVKRAGKYSSRPEIAAIPGANKGGKYLALNEMDDHWRVQRRFAHTVFTQAHAANYHGIIGEEVVRYLYALMSTPKDHFNQTDLFTARISSRLCYGSPSEAKRHSQNAHAFIAQISPTASGPIMNILPFLAKLPEIINPSRRWVRERQEKERALWIGELNRVKEQIESGSELAAPSYARTYFERQIATTTKGASNTPAGFNFPDSEAAYAIGMLCTMAIFTIAGPLTTFFLTMTLYPEWQEKVRDELQRVTGCTRPVTLSDSPDLPILRACIKECIRWKPPVPLGVPRLVTEDDEYEGYFIPKGSVVHIIEQALSYDPEMFPEPEKYNPARWLESSYPSHQEPLSVYPRLMGYSGFGSGRRVCPGVELTESELLVACGSLVSFFDLRPNVDEVTEEIRWPDPENRNSNVIGGPKAFEFDLRVREGMEGRIKEMFEDIAGES